MKNVSFYMDMLVTERNSDITILEYSSIFNHILEERAPLANFTIQPRKI